MIGSFHFSLFFDALFELFKLLVLFVLFEEFREKGFFLGFQKGKVIYLFGSEFKQFGFLDSFELHFFENGFVLFGNEIFGDLFGISNCINLL